MSLTEKGRRRREALLDAVVLVLEREGPGAVTHRAVAAQAGVPVSAATYYFATIDDLLIEALRRAVEEETALLQPDALADTADLARALHDYAVQRRATAVAHYELLLLATRRPALRPDAERWYASLEAALDAGFPSTAGEHPDERAQRLASAAMALDGLILRMLWRGEPSTPAEVERSLEPLLRPLLPAIAR
ncbi:TetR family transcriptional regulator [Microcella daejeonensis]|uniref:TetR family transcriptional regulator n=1 Tax=Microcella daejeonensis TaxID=2994971 RepID=A0A9E8SAS0_9MICO|nr:TetR family transcriptional regulator [Microcella daejeonensis]WAB80917.1 TetR family transcriptional regulator [Microcella daejeonensis]